MLSAYHAEVACVGEPVLHSGAFNGGWDEACMLVIGMMLTNHGRDMAGCVLIMARAAPGDFPEAPVQDERSFPRSFKPLG